VGSPQRGRPASPDVDLRYRLLTLLDSRVRKVRRATRYVYRNHPDIARLAMSATMHASQPMPYPTPYTPGYPPAAPSSLPLTTPRGPLDAWLVPLIAPMVGAFLGLFVGLFLEGDNIPLTKSFLGALRILWDLLVWLGAGKALVRSIAEGNTDQATALTGVLYMVALIALLAAVLLAVPVINLTVVAAGCMQLLGLAYGGVRLLVADARPRRGGYTVLRFLGAASVLWLGLGVYLMFRYSPGAVAAFLALTSPLPLSIALALSGLWLVVRSFFSGRV